MALAKKGARCWCVLFTLSHHTGIIKPIDDTVICSFTQRRRQTLPCLLPYSLKVSINSLFF
jgi:hypothetical protein